MSKDVSPRSLDLDLKRFESYFMVPPIDGIYVYSFYSRSGAPLVIWKPSE
jgi:hypothetical protein